MWGCYETSGFWSLQFFSCRKKNLTRLSGNIFLTLQIEVDENGKIIDAKFKTFGCGSAIASSSLATEWVKGKSVSVQTSNYTFCVEIELFVLCKMFLLFSF